jgi:putative toxin-antitoxin system antitoxin component (TIGR02293 family)
MGTHQLAEFYEELKELRRQGPSAGVREALEALLETNALLEEELASLNEAVLRAHPEALSRLLEIKTLADRVFGDEKRAEAWLQRPAAALSGQRPADLLKDELGAAVVREMLEQIDHGIFA